MGDSGAVFTTETTRNSVLKNTIFINFALKMVGRSYVKALSKKSENIVSYNKRQLSVTVYGSSSRLRLWPDFKSEHMYGLPMRAGCLEKS